MTKCLIATFGWTERYVFSSILRHGIEPGDSLILLVPAKKDEKSEMILRDFESFLGKYGEGISLEIKRVSIGSFDEAVAQIAEILKKELLKKPDEMIVNLSGGMRILILATYIATLLTCPNDALIELETEDRERKYTIPNLSIRNLIKLRKIQEEILKKLKREAKTTSKLLEELKIPRSTLHKYLRGLERIGLITVGKEDRTLITKATSLGRLILLGSE